DSVPHADTGVSARDGDAANSSANAPSAPSAYPLEPPLSDIFPPRPLCWDCAELGTRTRCAPISNALPAVQNLLPLCRGYDKHGCVISGRSVDSGDCRVFICKG